MKQEEKVCTFCLQRGHRASNCPMRAKSKRAPAAPKQKGEKR